MTLRGNAFLAIWHDIEAEAEVEFNHWHTVEHMPERVFTPGFLAGRRLIDPSLAKHRYFTLYEGEQLETFSSDAYRERLNNPTPWAVTLQPHYRNFVRSACLTASSTGRGTGGAMATVRMHVAPGADWRSDIASLITDLEGAHGVTAVHLGEASPETSHIVTKESELRASTGEEVFDGVILVDGFGRREVEAAVVSLRSSLEALPSVDRAEVAVYDLAYRLDTEEE